MGSSLRDQLLKAGLVDEKKARQAERDRRQKRKQANRSRKSGQPVPDREAEAAERLRQEQAMHAARSRELNQQREAERAHRALRLELRRRIQEAALPLGKGDVRYNFAENKKVKRIYVSRKQRDDLTAGRLGIVNWDGRHYLVPTAVADDVRERSPETFVFVAEPEPRQTLDPDDPYAAFPIPEDLDW